MMTGKMAQAESGNVSRKPDLGVIECITIVTASPKRWRGAKGSPSTQSPEGRARRKFSLRSRSAAWESRRRSRALIIYLCSDEAVFVTGANIAVNGGQHMQ
jgi:NAD(P)-dependent dehydrogenase (short-subunit alcohol dehydrogenase family)